VYKKSIINSQPFVKKMKNVRSWGGGFFDSHCRSAVLIRATRLCRYSGSKWEDS